MKKLSILFVLLISFGFVFAQEEQKLVVKESSVALPQLVMSNAEYKVTAGDVYTLAYAAGSSAVTYPIFVDSSYKIRVSNLAVIDASGKTFLELKKQVEDIVTKNYPLSGVQLTLTTPSTFVVVVKGEVTKTTEQKVWALTRLSDVIQGLTTSYSSTRDVVVTSSNGKSKTYDLFKAERDGDLSQNPYMRPGDVVTVKKAERFVTVRGSVERSGKYQLLKGENLKSLLNYYGNGLVNGADTNRIEITRYYNSDVNIGKTIYLTQKDIDSDVELVTDDVVYVPSIREILPVVFIEGAIAKVEEGELDSSKRVALRFVNETDYASLIRNNQQYFSSESDLQNAYIIRGEQIIPIDISSFLYDVTVKTNIKVEPYDVLRIPFKQYFVSVAGCVYLPGRYPYIPDRTWDYYVGLAGGIIQEKNSRGKVEIVDIDGKKLSKNDIITPETTITVPANSGLYYFGQYAPVITTVLSVISTTLSIIMIAK